MILDDRLPPMQKHAEIKHIRHRKTIWWASLPAFAMLMRNHIHVTIKSCWSNTAANSSNEGPLRWRTYNTKHESPYQIWLDTSAEHTNVATGSPRAFHLGALGNTNDSRQEKHNKRLKTFLVLQLHTRTGVRLSETASLSSAKSIEHKGLPLLSEALSQHCEDNQ